MDETESRQRSTTSQSISTTPEAPTSTAEQSAINNPISQDSTAQELIDQHLITGIFSSAERAREPPRPRPILQGRYYCPVCPPIYTYTYRTKNEDEFWIHVNHCQPPAVARSPHVLSRLVFSCVASATCKYTTTNDLEFHQHIWHHQIVGDNRFERLPGNKVLPAPEGTHAFDQQYPEPTFKPVAPSEAWFEKSEAWKTSQNGQTVMQNYVLRTREDEMGAEKESRRVLNSSRVNEVVIPRVYAWLARLEPFENAVNTYHPDSSWSEGDLLTMNNDENVEAADNVARDIRAFNIVVPVWLESQRKIVEEDAVEGGETAILD